MGIIKALSITPEFTTWAASARIGLRAFIGQMLRWHILGINFPAVAQTSSTAAIAGVRHLRKSISDALVEVRGRDLAVIYSIMTDATGSFVFPLLPSKTYLVEAHRNGFLQLQSISVNVPVTETIRLAITMKVSEVQQHTDVPANPSPLQSDAIALGLVLDSRAIESLPLV